MIRLISAPQYFPFRFHCISVLLKIIKATGVYVPVTPLILEILESPEVSKKPNPATHKALNFTFIIKTPAEYLHTRVYQDGLYEQTVDLLYTFFSCYCTSISFPELSLPVTLCVSV